MVSFWVFSVMAIIFGLVATVVSNIRFASLALWGAGLSTGGIFLVLGAEFLAVVQWITATVLCFSFLFFSSLYGPKRVKFNPWQFLATATLCVGFVIMIGYGARELPQDILLKETGVRLIDLGKTIVLDNFLMLELVVFILLMAIVGSGVMSRGTMEDDQ